MNHPNYDSGFDLAVEIVLDHEGGYSNSKLDPGGETIFGISKRSHPSAWKNGRPSKEYAKDIYRRFYWDACRCAELPSEVSIAVFDSAVNQGVRMASTLLQTAIGESGYSGLLSIDGSIGPQTIQAANAVSDKRKLLTNFMTRRIYHYSNLPHWGTYWRGWTRRVLSVLLDSMDAD